MTTVILLPVLQRPKRVAMVTDSIRSHTPEPHRILFICDNDDRPTQDAVAAAGAEMISPGGTYPQKINAGVAHTTEPLIFLGADDLHFHTNWLRNAIIKMVDGIGVVGTNDLGNERVITGIHSTHSLVARWYAELGQIDGEPGLLHEGYRHNFCDDELVGAARKRNAYTHAADSHVEHMHPLWGKGPSDDVYRRGQASFADDRQLHRARLRLWM